MQILASWPVGTVGATCQMMGREDDRHLAQQDVDLRSSCAIPPISMSTNIARQ